MVRLFAPFVILLPNFLTPFFNRSTSGYKIFINAVSYPLIEL